MVGDLNTWELVVDSQAGVRPAAAFGDSITPGNNTKGSWVQIFSAAEIADDIYELEVIFNSNVVATSIRDCLVDIGIDTAGGTSYSVLIPDLLVAGANTHLIGGVPYTFPIRIPAGSTVAARAAVNNATVGTLRIRAIAKGRPTRPDLIKFCENVQAVGVDSANSRGVAVPMGTTGEGAWTLIGTLTYDCSWFQIGVGFHETALSGAAVHYDVAADNAANLMILRDVEVLTTTGEAVTILRHKPERCDTIPAGTSIYARAQSSTGADTTSVIVYAGS